jgi:hypothetical protein
MQPNTTQPLYQAPSREWAALDARIVQQLLPDLRTIAEFGDPDGFKSYLRSLMFEAWRDFTELSLDLLKVDAAEELAVATLPVSPAAIRNAFQWDRKRKRLMLIAAEVRKEAERIRNQADGRRSA